jgi:hypothetical protein
MSRVNRQFVVIDKTDKKINGIFCHTCQFLIKSADDLITFKNWQTCHDCYLRFIEGRQQEWKDGWRPDDEKIKQIYEEKSRLFIK